MGEYLIDGGKQLYGSVNISRAKNAVLPILCASILTDEEVTVRECPDIADVNVMLDILSSLGARIKKDGKDVTICGKYMNSCEIDKFYACKMRSSVFLIGALLSRFGRISTYMPGGCDIGARPIDLHIKALSELNTFVCYEDGRMLFCTEGIKGNNITLPIKSVGATENVILASVFCEGETVLNNPALEPEVVDLAYFLNSMGAKVKFIGKKKVVIKGVKKLHGTVYLPIYDRIEAGSYITALLCCGGMAEIKGIDYKNISFFNKIFINNTCKIVISNDIINIRKIKDLKSFDFVTGSFPMFPTDMQAQFTVLGCSAQGVSHIREEVFENRFTHVEELKKMGADILVKDNVAFVRGKTELYGNTVYAKDLRGGASLVIAGLYAEGRTVVKNSYHIERGYEELEKKLTLLGARIKKV